jgi:hypothetical protein
MAIYRIIYPNKAIKNDLVLVALNIYKFSKIFWYINWIVTI